MNMPFLTSADIPGCDKVMSATAGTRKATDCSTLRTVVTLTPLATKVSASTPDRELPTAMTSQGRKARKLEDFKSKPRACKAVVREKEHVAFLVKVCERKSKTTLFLRAAHTSLHVHGG